MTGGVLHDVLLCEGEKTQFINRDKHKQHVVVILIILYYWKKNFTNWESLCENIKTVTAIMTYQICTSSHSDFSTKGLLEVEYFFELLHSSELYFMVLLTGVRENMTSAIVKMFPSPEAVARWHTVCGGYFREHFHFEGDLVIGISWHTGHMQQGVLAEACCSECQRGGFGSVW